MAVFQRYLPEGIQNYNQANVRRFPEGAGQTFVTGDLVTLTTNAVVGMTTGTLHGQKILGMAMQDASGTTGTQLLIYVFNQSTIIRVPVSNAGVGTVQVTATSQIGINYALWYTVATGILSVDVGTGVQNDGTLIDISQDFPVGEIAGLVDYQPLLVSLILP